MTLPGQEKQRLRKHLLAARMARSADELEAARRAVAEVVVGRARSRGWRRVCAYEPLRTEPGSVRLLEELVALGVQVLVPITLPDRDLDWREWPSGRSLGPDAIGRVDAVLVPALAVGTDGARLGRGGGSYDRALRRCAADAERIALVFDGEVLDDLPTEAWDVPVQAVITPSGWTLLDERPPAGNTAVAPGR